MSTNNNVAPRESMRTMRAFKLSSIPMASNMTKHFDTMHHYLRDQVDAETIVVLCVGKADMLADGQKKMVPEPEHTVIFKRCMDGSGHT
jgi:hypothetical protein